MPQLRALAGRGQRDVLVRGKRLNAAPCSGAARTALESGLEASRVDQDDQAGIEMHFDGARLRIVELVGASQNGIAMNKQDASVGPDLDGPPAGGLAPAARAGQQSREKHSAHWLTPGAAVCLLLAGCATSRVAETSAKAQATVTDVGHSRVEMQEDRGPVTTVVEEFAEPTAATPSSPRPSLASGFQPARPDDVTDLLRVESAPRSVLIKRTTITQAPIVMHTVATASERERAEVKAEVQTRVAEKSAPALGCQATALLIPLALLAAAAGAFALYRRFA